MLIQTQNGENGTNLFIALCENKEWSIFARLCGDLIDRMNAPHCKNENLLKVIDKRLEEWREFLHLYKGAEFSFIEQMGLFSELLCLKEIVAPQVGFENAVNAWVGAKKDKQDFVLETAALEVKSYISAKGAKVEISSAEQLYCDKAHFYLVAYGLTHGQNTKTCEDLVLEIKNELKDLPHTQQDFRRKLSEYGYMLGAQHSFIADSVMFFEVKENFPKITPPNIAVQISEVHYRLNLLQCRAFLKETIALK